MAFLGPPSNGRGVKWLVCTTQRVGQVTQGPQKSGQKAPFITRAQGCNSLGLQAISCFQLAHLTWRDIRRPTGWFSSVPGGHSCSCRPAYKQDSQTETCGTASIVLRWRTTHVRSTADSLCKCCPQRGQWVLWSTTSILLHHHHSQAAGI